MAIDSSGASTEATSSTEVHLTEYPDTNGTGSVVEVTMRRPDSCDGGGRATAVDSEAVSLPSSNGTGHGCTCVWSAANPASMPVEERSVKALTLADGTDKVQDGCSSNISTL